MNQIQRIEKGLDRSGLIVMWNSVEEETNYKRGLILTAAKEDCDNNSAMSWEKYLEGFMLDGKHLGKQYANQLLIVAKMRADDSEYIKKVAVQTANNLNETEAKLTLPESDTKVLLLKGDNAIQKKRAWEDVKNASGKSEPSVDDIKSFNKTNEANRLNTNTFQNQKTIPKLEKPDSFTSEEEIDFESWCIEVHSFDVVAEKPVHTRAIYALKDENVSCLFNRLSEWKSAYKIMAKLCHPDTGGNTLAFSMLSDFKELMDSLSQIQKIVDYENKVEQYRVEYSTPKTKMIGA